MDDTRNENTTVFIPIQWQLAGLLALLSSMGMVIIKVLDASVFSWWMPVLNFGIVLGLGYIVIHQVLKQHIFRRLGVIYQLLSDTNSKGANREKINGAQILDALETAVKHRVSKNQMEITRLKQLENYRKDFLGNVSHELKTPVFNIQGYVETLLDGGLEDEAINRKYLKRTAKNVKRLNNIIKDLTFITQSDNAMVHLSMRAVNIVSLIEDVLDAIEIQAEEAGVSIALNPSSLQHYMVEADREKIEQVLTNLLLNSIKYGKEGGRTTLSLLETSEKVIIEVKDNGIGIAKEHLPRLFERFYRVDKARSRQKGGTGLGLAIVKHIIEAHGQKIKVKSKLGKGSVFSFTLNKWRE